MQACFVQYCLNITGYGRGISLGRCDAGWPTCKRDISGPRRPPWAFDTRMRINRISSSVSVGWWRSDAENCTPPIDLFPHSSTVRAELLRISSNLGQNPPFISKMRTFFKNRSRWFEILLRFCVQPPRPILIRNFKNIFSCIGFRSDL